MKSVINRWIDVCDVKCKCVCVWWATVSESCTALYVFGVDNWLSQHPNTRQLCFHFICNTEQKMSHYCKVFLSTKLWYRRGDYYIWVRGIIRSGTCAVHRTGRTLLMDQELPAGCNTIQPQQPERVQIWLWHHNETETINEDRETEAETGRGRQMTKCCDG